jgi:hypothetical protein
MGRVIPPYLRVVPKPIAKCGPAPWPYPRTSDGVDVRRVGDQWRLEHRRQGRFVGLMLTTEELEDLVGQGRTLLERNRGDE